MHSEDPCFDTGDRVTIVPLRCDGLVRRAYFDQQLSTPRWLYYVRFRDGNGDLLGRYFTRYQLQRDDNPKPANFEP